VSKIKVLDELLVNKIAAGEVIERPASVVKELVENAIDAGATQVSVHIEDGGKRLIRIADDGLGMNQDDLRLAVTPHATSKIEKEDDLFSIATMGFRGEALPSIGAVSRMRIVSRPTDDIEGAEIIVAAKKIEQSRSAGCRVGTMVEIRDLFFNVPARRKFLKATSTEVGHINELFARLALAHRGVGFELTNNARVTHQIPASAGIVERIAALFGRDLADALIPIERRERGMLIEGYVAPPALSRSSGSWQYIFLNSRYIRDRFVGHAVREAYRGLMEHSRQPIVFLFLTVDPATVDVNVHPTKIEVRWENSNLIHSQVLAALRDKFLSSDLTPALQAPTSHRRFGDGPSRFAEGSQADAIRQQAVSFFKNMPPAAPGAPTDNWPPSDRDAESGTPPHANDRMGFDAAPWESRTESPEGSPISSDTPWHESGTDVSNPALQIHNTYLVAQTPEGMVIIDQHALHERIMYEKLRDRIVSDRLESQRLLLPETFSATASELALLVENHKLLNHLGVEAEPFGDDAIAVHAFPVILKDTDPVSFLRDLLDRLANQDAKTHTEEVVHEMLDMMACKAAVKAGDPLTPDEIRELIQQKDAVEKSSNCPHGRPTTLRISLNELEKQFKRR